MTLDTIYSIAFLFQMQEEYKKSLDYFHRALDGYQKIFGCDYIKTIDVVF
jgi:hypothetical protein